MSRGCWVFPRTTALIQVLWDQLVTSHTPQLGCKLFKGNRRPGGFIKKLDLELLVCSSLVAALYLLKCCFPLAPQMGCKRLGSERMDTGCSHRLLGPERPDCGPRPPAAASSRHVSVPPGPERRARAAGLSGCPGRCPSPLGGQNLIHLSGIPEMLHLKLLTVKFPHKSKKRVFKMRPGIRLASLGGGFLAPPTPPVLRLSDGSAGADRAGSENCLSVWTVLGGYKKTNKQKTHKKPDTQ